MKILLKIILISLVCLSAGYARDNQELSVYAGFEGGSVKVVSINQQTKTIVFKPGGDSTRGWPNWWYFRVEGATPGEKITVVLDNPAIGFWAKPDRASYSNDGKSWHYTAPGTVAGESVTYSQTAESGSIWFAWGSPFVVSTGKQLIQEHIHAGMH